MARLGRQTCLAVLLLLLLSHAAMTLHVTTHAGIDRSNCEYCSGSVNPAHALASSATELPWLAAAGIAVERVTTALRVVRPMHYRERAPPAVL
jgi:hypothetical protein